MLLEQFVLTAAKAFKKFLAIDRLHPAAFQVVIAAVEHFAGAGQFVEITGHGVLNQLFGGTSRFRYPAVEPGL